MEGSVIFGLTAALHGEITIRQGRVEQVNFPQYEMLRMAESPRIETRHTHGTGCTLATAIACGLAEGRALPDAVGRAIAFVQNAIRTAPGLGQGHGPLNHSR